MRPEALTTLPPPPQSGAGRTLNADQLASLHEAAEALEATFLSEMLKSAGLGETSDSFGGGQGEAQFASFLRDEQARGMAQAGGIGLAESLFKSLTERANG